MLTASLNMLDCPEAMKETDICPEGCVQVCVCVCVCV